MMHWCTNWLSGYWQCRSRHLAQNSLRSKPKTVCFTLRINDDKALVNTLGNSLKKVSVDTVNALTRSKK